MAQHGVRFTIPERSLGKADVEFAVWRNGSRFGSLRVSKGSIVWFPKDNSYGHKISWAQFDSEARKYP